MNDFTNPSPPEASLVCLICRCSSPNEHAQRATDAVYETTQREQNRLNKEREEFEADRQRRSPNIDQFEILDVLEVGPHLVMKVKYPNCTACSYEGTKIMVFLDTKVIDAIKWRQIDPHFRLRPANDHHQAHPKYAPSPAARFPGDMLGWEDARDYAKSKSRITR